MAGGGSATIPSPPPPPSSPPVPQVLRPPLLCATRASAVGTLFFNFCRFYSHSGHVVVNTTPFQRLKRARPKNRGRPARGRAARGEGTRDLAGKPLFPEHTLRSTRSGKEGLLTLRRTRSGQEGLPSQRVCSCSRKGRRRPLVRGDSGYQPPPSRRLPSPLPPPLPSSPALPATLVLLCQVARGADPPRGGPPTALLAARGGRPPRRLAAAAGGGAPPPPRRDRGSNGSGGKARRWRRWWGRRQW